MKSQPGKRTDIGFTTRALAALAAGLLSFAVQAQQAGASAAAPTEFQPRNEAPAAPGYAQIDERYNGLPSVNLLAAISGKVSADQGIVHAFRVKAHDIVHKIYYTVYTNKGVYHFYALPAGTYEVFVLPYEDGYELAPVKLDLLPGKTEIVDLTLKFKARADTTQYLAWDQIYPDEPGKKELIQNCMSCHGRLFFHRLPRDRAAWEYSVNRMTTGVPTWTGLPNVRLSTQERDLILTYLTKNFAPGQPPRDVRLDDRNSVINEEVLSHAIWTEYEYFAAPSFNDADEQPAARTSFGGFNVLHDAFISPLDGTIWLSSPGTDAAVNLDPRILSVRDRWHTYPVKQAGRLSWEHGITVDSKGHVWLAEIADGKLGELNPSTGEFVQHETPHLGSILQVAADQEDNIWYGHVHGGFIGRYNAKTRSIQDWAMPISDSSAYGIAIDHEGSAWFAGWGRNLVLKFNPKSFRFSEYFTTTVPSGVRRLGIDRDDNVWFSENSGEGIGLIEKGSGRIREFRAPLHWTEPYETWPDNRGTIWVTDAVYGSLIAFDAKTRKWGSYYPQPQSDHWSIPKIEIDSEGTIWMGSRGVPNLVAVKFQPRGNVPVSFETAVINSPNTTSWSSKANIRP